MRPFCFLIKIPTLVPPHAPHLLNITLLEPFDEMLDVPFGRQSDPVTYVETYSIQVNRLI